MNARYKVGSKVTAFVAFGAIGYVDANFYTGTIKDIAKSEYSKQYEYHIEYIADDNEIKSVTALETEIDFVFRALQYPHR